jgi:peptide/nickel transport system substrate-binding protein
MFRWIAPHRLPSLVGVLALVLAAACTAAPAPPPAPTAAPAAKPAPTAAPAAQPTAPAAAPAKPAAPAPTQAAAPAASGVKSEIVVVQSADVPSLDPAKNLVIHVFNVAQNVLDTATYLDRDLKVQPRLATSWKSTDDTTWEVKLRTGVKFHDGTPFNSQAVKASFDYQSASDTPARSFFANWGSLDVVDESTVRIKTKAPEPYFPNVLSRLWIFSPADLKDPTTLATSLNGTGGYKLTEFVKGDHITLVANPEYWAGAPKVQKVVFRAAPEASARVAMLQAGQADVIVNLPVEQTRVIEGDNRLRAATVLGLRAVPLMIDQRKGAPLSDVRVRQAMNFAVDREAIIKNILGGYAAQQPATISPLIEGNDRDIKPYAYDPEKAKQLLAEAGYASGFEINFYHPTGRWMKDAEAAQAIGQMLGKVGIKTNLKTLEYSTFFTNWSKGEFDGMTMIGVTNPDGAPNSLFNLFLHSKGSWPYSLTDPKLDQLIEKARSTMDREERTMTYREIEKFVHDQAAWIFLWEQKDIYGVNKALKWEPAPNEMIYLWDAAF